MKQTRTTIQALTSAYRAVLRHGILCNAIALGLIATAPAMANNDPNTTGNAWVFGDIVLANAPVRQATIGGRRINNWDGDKYQNDIPSYNMVGQSLSVTNSNMYVGPVSLELRAIDAANDTFAYNYQWDTDGDNINNDVDLANWAGVGWNEDYTNAEHTGVYDKIAAKINSEGGYDNANDTAPGVYMFSRLDTTHANAGKMSFDGSTVTVNGTTVNADSISVTNGSQLTFTKETTLSLEDFNGGNIDSNGKTTLNAGTINIDGSRMVVNSGAELNINATNGATFANGSSNDDGGAIYNAGKMTIAGNADNKATFADNKAGSYGGAVRTTVGSDTTVKDALFTRNKVEGTSQYQLGAAMFVSGKAVIEDSVFDSNKAVGDSGFGGAIYAGTKSDIEINRSKFTNNEAASGGALDLFKSVKMTDVTVSGNKALSATDDGAGGLFLGAVSTSTLNSVSGSVFENNTSAASAGALGMRKFKDGNNKDAALDISGTKFNGNVAATTGGAIDNYFYNSASHAGAVSVENSEFVSNQAANGGAIYNHVGQDGDILNAGEKQVGSMYLTDSTFAGNSAEKGGAVYNAGTMNLVNAIFNEVQLTPSYKVGNIAETGGAIYNNAGQLTVSGIFTGNKANGTTGGGAIYNATDATLETNADFVNNKANGEGARGGAIYSKGTLNITGGTYTGNEANARGGAINAQSGTATIKGVTFGGDTSDLGNSSSDVGGAIAINSANVTIEDTVIKNNHAINNGGAIFDNKGSLTLTNSVIENNSAAGKGAGIYNSAGEITLTDTVVKNNVVDTVLDAEGKVRGGAGIYNAGSGLVTVNAINKDITFSGNNVQAGGVIFKSDIYNSGALTLNAAADRTLALDGGIDGGGSGTMWVNAGATNTGIVKVAGTLNGQDVTVAHGELHLIDDDPMLVDTEGAYLAGSTINVASGATINTIDDAIQDLSSFVTLADGAGIKGDINFELGTADKYASETGAVTYKMGNLIGAVGSGVKNIQVASNGTKVNKDAGFGWFNSATGLTLESSGAADGMIKLTGLSGGIGQAADASATVNEVKYDLTEDESVVESKSLYNKFVLTGDGTTDADKGLELAGADLTVADGATAEINDLKLAGTGAINNAATGVLKINNSNVGVRVRNAGILYSDPTTYADTLTNTGVANIDGDTFAATGVLENYNVANLTNATFETDATITGTGTTNLVSGTTAFNSTANSNTVKVASGAGFTGALVGGTLNTHNGAIDTISGAFNGGNVVLDAKLGTTPTADRITGNAGTITEINILGTEYGTTNSATLTVGGTLDSNVQINGMNYYTSVVDNGDGTVTFSDKLINKSTLDTTLADYATSDDLTTGLAGKQDTIDDLATIRSGAAAGATALQSSALADTALTGNTTAENLAVSGTMTVGGNAVLTSASTLDGAKLTGGSVAQSALSSDVQTLLGKANTALQSGANITALNNDAGYQTATQVSGAITTALAGKADAATTLAGYGITDAYTKTQVDTALAAKADAATTLSGYGITDAYTKGEVDTALATKADAATTLSGYGITDAYTKGEVDNAITTALANTNGQGGAYQTETAVETKIENTAENATFTASTANSNSGSLNGANTVKGAINNVAGAVDTLANNMGKVHGLVSNENGVKTLHETNNSTNTSNVVGGEYKGNLAVGTTVEDHLIALDNAIGTMSALDTTNGWLSNTASVATNLQSLDNAAASNAQKIQKIVDGTTTVAKATDATNAVNATNDGQGRNIASTYATLQLVNDTVGDMATVSGTHVSNTASVATNLNQLSAAIDSISADSIAAANSYTDKRVESLDKNLSAGVAGAVALSSVAVSGVERGEVSVGAGYGYFNGQSAAAVGAAMGLSNRWSINAGAGISNADVSFRAGTNYKFKLF